MLQIPIIFLNTILPKNPYIYYGHKRHLLCSFELPN